MILKNVKIKWPRLGDNPAKKFESDLTEWVINCTVTEELQAEWLKKKLIKTALFDKETGEPFVKIKSNTHYNKKNPVTGEMEKVPMDPPFVKDKYGDEMDQAIIGNGSICNVQYVEREYTNYGGGFIPTLVGVQVVTLEKYSGGSTTDEFTYVVKPTVDIVEEDDEDVPF